MSEPSVPESPTPLAAPEPAATPAPRRSAWRLLGRGLKRVLQLTAILLAVALVATLTVDLGPHVRGVAERAGGNYLKRDFTIGRLSIRLLTGHVIVEDLHIGGLEKTDRPFLDAKRIEVALDFRALAHREVLIESVRMSDWTMAVETWPNGRHSFPKFARERTEPPGPKRFVTTVRSVVADRGEFYFADHGVPWSTVARNLEVTVRKTEGYGGTARFTNGTVAIQQYLPMKTDMDGVFTIEGPLVKFSQLQLLSDGSRSDVTGTVDLSRWPEQTWNVKSVVDFPRMREIFFARERWVLGGEGHFTGVFHLFKGGRELKGDFTSAEARVNSLRFPHLAGSLIWVPDWFEVTRASSDFYGGKTRFTYGLKPLGVPQGRPTAHFDAEFEDVDLGTLGTAFEWTGIRPAGRMSGSSRLKWPNGRFAERHGDGALTVEPVDGVALLGREMPADARQRDETRVRPWGPFNPDPQLLGDVPVGGEITWQLGPEWIESVAVVDGNRAHLRELRGTHRLRRALRDPVPRHEHRLAGKRSRACRHHDRLRLADDGGARRRHRSVRRDHAPGVPAPAHRGPIHRRAAGCVGRGLGHGVRRPGHRERICHDDQRPRRRRRRGHRDRGPLRARLPAARRGRGDRRAGAYPPASARRSPARLPPRRLPDRRQGLRRVPPLRQVPDAVRIRPAADRRGRRLRRAVRDGHGVAALRGRRRAPRRHRGREGRRPDDRRRVRRLGRLVLVQLQRPPHPGRIGARSGVPAGAADGAARVHRVGQRPVRVAAVPRCGSASRTCSSKTKASAR